MAISMCGLDCSSCPLNQECHGCTESCGRPFGEECLIATCKKKGPNVLDEVHAKLIKAFNDLHIEGMEEVTILNSVRGKYLNVEYSLPNGQKVRFWNDDMVLFGNLLKKKDSDKSFGLAADMKYLIVSECNDNGTDCKILVYERWND